MGRRFSREFAMQCLFQFEFQEEIDVKVYEGDEEYQKLAEREQSYVQEILQGVAEHLAFIDTQIEMFSKGWKLSRISKVDLAILRLGIYEIFFRPDIPFNVSVNEAVELAKKYSSEESGAFVNGILASVVKHHKPKSGDVS